MVVGVPPGEGKLEDERRNRLERVFTFDRHFGSAGFEILPKR